LPSYLGYPEREIDLRRGTADVLTGSEITYIGTVSRELHSASLTASPVQSIPVRGSTFESEPVPVTADSQTVILEWEDSVGLGPREPFSVRITPVEDRPPTGDAQELSRIVALLEEDTLNLNLLSRDDYGVKEVGISWETAPDAGVPGCQGSALAASAATKPQNSPLGRVPAKAYEIAPQNHLWVYRRLPSRQGRASPRPTLCSC
jgi:hypothetical protein